MPKPKTDEQSRHTIEHQTPGESVATGIALFQNARKRHQRPISENHRQPIERIANAHKPRLLMLVEFQHIITVGGDVVCSTRECHQEETEHRPLEPKVGVQRESHSRQRRA